MITHKETHCIVCGVTIFIINPSVTNQKYCSNCKHKKKRNYRSLALETIENSDGTRMRHCKKCNTLFELQSKGGRKEYCSAKCKPSKTSNSVTCGKKRAITRKQKLIELAGGGCIKCGYNKCLAALHFHHIDPLSKDFPLDIRRIRAYSWHTILSEFNKCQLLCANCHAEEHHSID